MSLAINDMLTPALKAKLAKIKNKAPVLKAAGAALAGIAVGAFRDASLRPAEWDEKVTDATLRKPGRSGLLLDRKNLWQSILAKAPETDGVEVVTNAEYGIYHQFGTRKMPARPFFPVVGDSLTPKAERAVVSAMEGQINALLR